MDVKASEQDLVIRLPPSLQRRLDRDAEFARQGRIARLPARCSVLATLEAFIRWKAHVMLSEFITDRSSADGGDACELRSAVEARQFRKRIALERVRFLIEVVDAIRVSFDNLLPLVLLRKEERDAYELLADKLSNSDCFSNTASVCGKHEKPSSLALIKTEFITSEFDKDSNHLCKPKQVGNSPNVKRKSAAGDSLDQIFALVCNTKRRKFSHAADAESNGGEISLKHKKSIARVRLNSEGSPQRRYRANSGEASPMRSRSRSLRSENQNHKHPDASTGSSISRLNFLPSALKVEATPNSIDSTIRQVLSPHCKRPHSGNNQQELTSVCTPFVAASHGRDASLLIANSLASAVKEDNIDGFVETVCSPSWHLIAHPNWMSETGGGTGAPMQRDYVRPSLIFGATHLIRLLSKLTAIRCAQLDALSACRSRRTVADPDVHANSSSISTAGRPNSRSKLALKPKSKSVAKAGVNTTKSNANARPKADTKRAEANGEAPVAYDEKILERFCVAETSAVLRELLAFLANAADGVQEVPPGVRLGTGTGVGVGVGVTFESDADYVSVAEQCAYARRSCATELYCAVVSNHFHCCNVARTSHTQTGRNGASVRHCAPLCNRSFLALPAS